MVGKDSGEYEQIQTNVIVFFLYLASLFLRKFLRNIKGKQKPFDLYAVYKLSCFYPIFQVLVYIWLANVTQEPDHLFNTNCFWNISVSILQKN